MKKLFTLILLTVFSASLVFAADIPNINDSSMGKDREISYPVRDNALIVVLQPAPDGSGEFIMNICNKHSVCRQTSMLQSEIRYVGLFIEDFGASLISELNKKYDFEQYIERQAMFRKLYADYMNLYDKSKGNLEALQ